MFYMNICISENMSFIQLQISSSLITILCIIWVINITSYEIKKKH